MPFLEILSPLQKMKKQTNLLLLMGTLLTVIIMWALSPSALLPTPSAVMTSFHDLWMDGLAGDLVISYTLNLQSIFVATVVSLGLAYLSVVPIFKPLVNMSTGLRFLSMAGLSLAFQIAITNPHQVKVALLAFSISVWFLAGMLDVIAAIPQEQLDLARTLRMGPWRVVWEVVILGTLDKAFDVLRQTAAIGWMMLTMVESMVFAEGGIGTVLQTLQKHMRLSDIMAIQISILIMGMSQDYFIGFLKNQLCPYAENS